MCTKQQVLTTADCGRSHPPRKLHLRIPLLKKGQRQVGVGGQDGKSTQNTPEKKNKLSVDEETAMTTVYNPFASKEEKRLSKVDPDALENGIPLILPLQWYTSGCMWERRGNRSAYMMSFQVCIPAEVN